MGVEGYGPAAVGPRGRPLECGNRCKSGARRTRTQGPGPTCRRGSCPRHLPAVRPKGSEPVRRRRCCVPIPTSSGGTPQVSRLSALAAHPRRTVGALAAVLAAVGITVGSGANFTAKAANPANTFTAGTLSIDNSRGNGSNASAIFTAPNLKPGDSANGTVDIQNQGSVPGAFTLSTSTPQDSTPVSLLGQLDVRIEDCGPYTNNNTTMPTCGSASSKVLVTSAKLNAVGSIDLGSFAASEKHRYKFDVTLPAAT